jgi:U4/U6.U5 tri-snRNP-associated protein 2
MSKSCDVLRRQIPTEFDFGLLLKFGNFFRDAMDSGSEDDYLSHKKRLRVTKMKCPYLDTINRFSLDFDFEKTCSVTLSNTNVYACLVCGRYFQGRGKETPAYIHSMEHGHHLFINLRDGSVWCLPDTYEVHDESFSDILFNLNPKFTPDDLERLPSSAVSLTGSEYHPGLVGLNQSKDASYLNAVVHSLCAVVPVRNHFVLSNETEDNNKITTSFANLLKKINNWKSFKGLTSPHEFLQQVISRSKGEFSASHGDAAKFLEWLLPNLQADMTELLISRSFRGESSADPFLILSLDLPVMPVFKDEKEFIPTVLLTELLEKRFRSEKIVKLPPFMILHYRRLVKNNFFVEKNSTIVRFPVKGMDMSPYCAEPTSAKYSLISSIVHEGKPGEGVYKANVLHPVSGQWFGCEAIRVKKVLPESVALMESYVQIWRRD